MTEQRRMAEMVEVAQIMGKVREGGSKMKSTLSFIAGDIVVNLKPENPLETSLIEYLIKQVEGRGTLMEVKIRNNELIVRRKRSGQ